MHALTFVIKPLLKHQNPETLNGSHLPEELAQKEIPRGVSAGSRDIEPSLASSWDAYQAHLCISRDAIKLQ